MTIRRRSIVLVLVLAATGATAVAVGGCCGHESLLTPTAHLVAGEVTLWAGTESERSWPLADGLPDGSGCGLAGAAEFVHQVDDPARTRLYVVCDPESAMGLENLDLHVPDLRDAPVGPFTTSEKASLKWRADDGTSCFSVPSEPAAVTVDEASGGSAPEPDLVSDDFARVATAAEDVLVGEYEAASCSAAAPVRFSITFRLGADDYRRKEGDCL